MPDKNNFAFHFMAPFPLEKCKRRIQNLHEDSTLFAWKGQTRLVAKVWDVNDHAAAFKVYRASKSSLEFQGSWAMTHARGILKQEGEQTEVVGEVVLPTLGQIITWVLVLILWGWFSYFMGMMMMAAGWHPAALIFASGGLLNVVILGTWYFQDSARKDLKRLVEATLQEL